MGCHFKNIFMIVINGIFAENTSQAMRWSPRDVYVIWWHDICHHTICSGPVKQPWRMWVIIHTNPSRTTIWLRPTAKTFHILCRGINIVYAAPDNWAVIVRVKALNIKTQRFVIKTGSSGSRYLLIPTDEWKQLALYIMFTWYYSECSQHFYT